MIFFPKNITDSPFIWHKSIEIPPSSASFQGKNWESFTKPRPWSGGAARNSVRHDGHDLWRFEKMPTLGMVWYGLNMFE